MNDLSGNQKRLVFVLFFAMLLGLISIIYRSLHHGSMEVVELELSNQTLAENSSEDWRITVHLCGAVNKPGVYSFKPGTRLYQAVEKAGGYLPNADTNSLNLAVPIEDGKRIYIPYKNIGESSPNSGPSISTNQINPKASPPKEKNNSKKTVSVDKSSIQKICIDPNSATRTELESIPGIGPVLAGRILDYRLKHGHFQNVDDLLQVKGIGPKTLKKIRGYLNIKEI